MLAGPLLAQTYDQQPAPTLNDRSTTMEWLIAAGFLVGCLGVAFKSAKRANLK
jgi:hypothetical protein